ncbi:hypothetical protein DXT89_19685 [Agrobacterium vitis]|uniref:Uncharacterized protein n=1 Tax=Agrobacterium vitis TaxID=373 RepID=A0A368NS18_AGRVI|nr:hypothetical protein DXM22_08760 [Agrobacterium vitis]KAA3523681.1 hypothetical protein DXT89_19720 [Agrobacterium vitis]KAA3524195.1 hypothetical protein DXT89_19685 [Agrobacterium vitis]RCU53352.1 hypothetical protein ASB66_017085 [Agrobacterium vitis]
MQGGDVFTSSGIGMEVSRIRIAFLLFTCDHFGAAVWFFCYPAGQDGFPAAWLVLINNLLEWTTQGRCSARTVVRVITS